MRNEIDTVGIFFPDYFLDRKDLTIEEAYILALIYELVKRHERIDYSNKAFANKIHRNERSISRWLDLLEKRKYIEMKGNAQNRIIFLTKKTFKIRKDFHDERGNE